VSRKIFMTDCNILLSTLAITCTPQDRKNGGGVGNVGLSGQGASERAEFTWIIGSGTVEWMCGTHQTLLTVVFQEGGVHF